MASRPLRFSASERERRRQRSAHRHSCCPSAAKLDVPRGPDRLAAIIARDGDAHEGDRAAVLQKIVWEFIREWEASTCGCAGAPAEILPVVFACVIWRLRFAAAESICLVELAAQLL